MIRQNIKNSTKNLHDQLESKVRSIIFKEDLSPIVYQTLIESFYTAYLSLETNLGFDPVCRELLKDRTKTPALLRDAQFLESFTGLNDMASEALKLPDCNTSGYGLGQMYVMEGATLGGKVISTFLNRHHWIDYNGCLNFFNCYGEDHINKWKEFIEFVESYFKQHPEEENDFRLGAEYAFKFIDKIITTFTKV